MSEQSQKVETKKIIQDDEIDLLELVRVLWGKRRFILKVTGIFALLGLLIAFTSKVEYEASCKLMPEVQEATKGNLGGLGSLAGLAGIDLGLNSTGSLTPQLYPEIAKSVPFLWDVLNTPTYFEQADTTVSAYIYFTELDRPSILGWITKYTVGLPGIVIGWFKSEEALEGKSGELLRFSKDDAELLMSFTDRVSVNVDEKTGVTTVNVEMPDPYAAAWIADRLVKKLTEDVTAYKVGKAQINLEFIQEQYLESEKAYQRKQVGLANFVDKNKNITSALIQTEYQRLQNELNIAFEVYKGLATQLEQAKIKVKEETPVFTVLEPVRVPEDKSKPKRAIICLVFMLLGGMVGVGLTLVKNKG